MGSLKCKKYISAFERICFFFVVVVVVVVFVCELGFTPCKAGQPLQGMELQEKEA